MAMILNKRHILLGAILLAGGLGSGQARAQPTITDPQQVAACLCAQSAMTNAEKAMRAQQSSYQAATDRLKALNGQVAAKHDAIDPNQPDQLDAYRRLVAESEKANAFLYNHATPDYNDAVNRFNDSVSVYNTTCAGRGIAPDLKARISANLFCPATNGASSMTTTSITTTTVTAPTP